MSKAISSGRRELVDLLGGYRRPGSPVFAYHYRRLPAKVLEPENGDALLNIMRDERLPAGVRDHAAGALGQMGFRKAIPALIDALGSPKTRRGAATALGLLKAEEAQEALAELARQVGAARWAHEEVSTAGSVGEILASLRDGHLHRIRHKIAALDDRAKSEVGASLARILRTQVAKGNLASSDRWMVTSLQYLAPEEAADVIADTLRASIRVTNCCGCLCKRTTWAAAAIGSPKAIPALVEVIDQSRRPQNVQQAAVAIEKIAKAPPKAASAFLRKEAPQLVAAYRRLRKSTAATRKRSPRKPWDAEEGTPRWFAASARAENAVERVMMLANASCNAGKTVKRNRTSRPNRRMRATPDHRT